MSRFASAISEWSASAVQWRSALCMPLPRSPHELLHRAEKAGSAPLAAAVRFVTECKDDVAVGPLLELLVRCEESQVASIVHGIATLGGDDALLGLAAIMADRACADSLRLAAAYGLTWLFDEQAFPALLACCIDPRNSGALRAQAAEGITYLASNDPPGSSLREATIEILLAGLTDETPEMRYWAVLGVGSLKVESAASALRLLAAEDVESDEEPLPIHREAREALRELEMAVRAA